jgi:deoxyribonuclease IV
MPPSARTPNSRREASRKFGAHMSIAGGYDRAVWAAKAATCATVQIFTKSNTQWRAAPLLPEQAAAFRAALDETGIVQPIGHTSYLINLGSPDDVIWTKSIAALVVEIQRCQLLGIGDLVMHPGAHMGSGEDAGLARIARGLNQAMQQTAAVDVTIDLETTAGQGTNLGYRFEQLQGILELVDRPERFGVCADTCHIFAAGYSLATRREYDKTIDGIDRSIGLKRLRVWHVNDSVRECGSRVDRHAGIGAGQMGLEPFRHLVNDARFRPLPMILETPKGIENGEDLDVRNLRVLRQLVRAARSSRRRR